MLGPLAYWHVMQAVLTDVLSVNRPICRVFLDVRLINAGRAFVDIDLYLLRLPLSGHLYHRSCDLGDKLFGRLFTLDREFFKTLLGDMRFAKISLLA
jgi:hypothetical protein